MLDVETESKQGRDVTKNGRKAMSKKRVLFTSILRYSAVLATAAVFAGSTGAAAADGPLKGETLRIIGLGDPVFQAMQNMHAELEKLGGGKVELEIKGFDVLHQQVLLNSQAEVSAYDLIPVDLPQFGEYKTLLMDLTPLIKEANYDSSDFQKAAWEGAQQDGMQLALPIQPQPEIFAYRKDIFDKHGVKPPETTEDMLAAAKALHNKEPGMAGMCWNGQRGTPLGQAFIQILGSHGQPPIAEPKKGDADFDISSLKPEHMHPQLDTPQAQAVANLLKELLPYSPPGVLNMAWGDSYHVMAQGGCAMGYVWSGYTGTWEADPKSPAKGKFVYLPHPHAPGVQARSPLGGWFLGIPKNIDPARLPMAWAALQWLTSPEMMTKYTENGDCVAPRNSVSNDPKVIERCPAVKAVNDYAQAGMLAAWQRPPIPQIQFIYDTLGAEMHEMLSGKKTPEEATKASQEIVDRQMQKDGVY
jgi:multiple sugar transport system substrate-binding protein